ALPVGRVHRAPHLRVPAPAGFARGVTLRASIDRNVTPCARDAREMRRRTADGGQSPGGCGVGFVPGSGPQTTRSSAMYVVWNVSVFTVAPFFLKMRCTETSNPELASCSTQPGLGSWIVCGER